MKKSLIVALTIGLCGSIVFRANAQLTIADQTKSTFSIVLPAGAPSSVQSAAQELQKDIEIATGAKLPLREDSKLTSSKYISIGLTQQAEDAGIQIASIPDDGFRILTQKGNLYILGSDTPDGKWTKNGGVSNGTANGVYTFLEDYLNVRWLMPGEIGRDVPRKSTFVLNDINRRETPMFMWRNMPHIIRFTEGKYRDIIRDWGSHQKLGASIQLNYNHNWPQTVPPDLFKEHPEWFAMKNGKRVVPTGQYKLETTNQELVRFYAEKAIAALKKADRPTTFSLSPSDGRGWSDSPESLALYDPVPPGRDHPAVSSLVLKWYRDVAQIVEKEYPQGKLAGYIYSDYVFPPTKINMKLPNNFTPMLCGIGSYGYQLYKVENQQQWKKVLAAWTKVAPENWFYYDLPNQLWVQHQASNYVQFTGNTANVTPPAPEILNLIFSNLITAKIKGTTIFSDPAWSNSALSNYIIAKLMWNPKLDANDLQQEWLQRAYGVPAGKRMELFYQKLNDIFRNYYQQHTSSEANNKLTDDMLQNIYAAHYNELEQLFSQAKGQPATEIQKQRLLMIEDNLIVLQWRLRNAGFLKTDFKSTLQRTDKEVAEIIETKHPDLDYFPGVIPLRTSSKSPQFSKLEVKRVTLNKTLPASKDELKLPNKTTYMIYAAKNGKVRIMPRMVNHGSMFTAYFVMGRRRGTVASGILIKDRPIEFDGEAGQDYYLYVAPRKNIGYDLIIDGAVTAKSTFDATSGTLFLQDENAPLYVYPNHDVNATSTGVIIATAPTLEILQQKFRNAKVINLDKEWKFYPDALSETGCYKPTYDDSAWKTINAHDWWQNQGFPNYRGKAWYRKKITVPQFAADQKALLHFSAVDGTAVVFLNGKRLGSHRVGSDFAGWDEPFYFDVTEILQPGDNTIAVQVTSKSQDTASGIQGTVNVVGICLRTQNGIVA
jgi:hypothetical protein